MIAAALLVMWGVAFSGIATADAPPFSGVQCSPEPPAMPERYERLHQVPTKPRPDDPTDRMITPGGMILETPRMVAVSDRLTITARDLQEICFEVVTFSRDRSRCEIRGVARAEESGMFLFREAGFALRLTPLAPDRIKIDPIGDGHEEFCESSGRIDSAVYTLQTTGS